MTGKSNNKIDIEFKNVTKNYFMCKNDIQRLGVFLFPSLRKKRVKKTIDNVSFKIHQGEKVALVGKNGAGKSTILKMISNIVKPSSGEITVNRRVSTLLDVGAGFEPEFTGRDNVYIRGTLLGYSKKQIDEVFNQILEFSEVGDFIDMEMRRYSAGMLSKLGFSINMFLHPEILIVDEALSVGDAKFNAKAKKEISKLSKKENLTLIIVSHNEETLHGLCNRGILVQNNHIEFDGPISKCLKIYNEKN